MLTTGSRRAAARILAATCGVVGALVFTAPSAHAVDLVTCTGSEISRYSPFLSNTPQLVETRIDALYQPCVNALNPLEFRTGVASGTIGARTRTCNDLFTTQPGERVIRWSTGRTSTYTFNTTVTMLAGGVLQSIHRGQITAGDFAGSTAVEVVVLAQTALDACATTGVPSVGGPITLTIAL
jgi:hypothetical protein